MATNGIKERAMDSRPTMNSTTQIAKSRRKAFKYSPMRREASS